MKLRVAIDVSNGWGTGGRQQFERRLWPHHAYKPTRLQVSNHMTKVADILARLHGPEKIDDGGAFGTREGGWRNLESTCGDTFLHNLQAEERSSKLLFPTTDRYGKYTAFDNLKGKGGM